jgi:hypothetical protein
MRSHLNFNQRLWLAEHPCDTEVTHERMLDLEQGAVSKQQPACVQPA